MLDIYFLISQSNNMRLIVTDGVSQTSFHSFTGPAAAQELSY